MVMRQPWTLDQPARAWQEKALKEWERNLRGVVSVVTGAGKTYFALQCMSLVHHNFPRCRFLIIVPTTSLLDQWHAAVLSDLGLTSEDIGLIGGGHRDRSDRAVTIAVLDSARSLTSTL